MIGRFDEEGFKRELRAAMGWGPGALAADAVVEFTLGWFERHGTITLPCRDAVQTPEKNEAVVGCRCGARWRVTHVHGVGWEASKA